MNKTLRNYGGFAVFVLGVAAGILLLLQSFQLGSSDNLLEGTKVIFGGMKDNSSISFDFKFNIMLFLAFLTPILAAVVGLFMKNKLGSLLSLLLFAASIVLLLVTKETSYQGSVGGLSATVKVAIELAPLGWISLSLSGIGALTTVGLILQ